MLVMFFFLTIGFFATSFIFFILFLIDLASKKNYKTTLTLFLTFLGVGVLCSLLVGAFKTSNNKNVSTDTSESSELDTGESQEGIDIQESEENVETDSNSAVIFGEGATSGNLLIKINEVGDTSEIIENDFYSYKPDSGKYAIINVTIENTGKELESLSGRYFKLVTADEIEYSPTTLIGLNNEYLNYESLNPGLDTTGNLVFNVPNDFIVSDAQLRFSGIGLFDEFTYFDLK